LTIKRSVWTNFTWVRRYKLSIMNSGSNWGGFTNRKRSLSKEWRIDKLSIFLRFRSLNMLRYLRSGDLRLRMYLMRSRLMVAWLLKSSNGRSSRWACCICLLREVKMNLMVSCLRGDSSVVISYCAFWSLCSAKILHKFYLRSTCVLSSIISNRKKRKLLNLIAHNLNLKSESAKLQANLGFSQRRKAQQQLYSL